MMFRLLSAQIVAWINVIVVYLCILQTYIFMIGLENSFIKFQVVLMTNWPEITIYRLSQTDVSEKKFVKLQCGLSVLITNTSSYNPLSLHREKSDRKKS